MPRKKPEQVETKPEMSDEQVQEVENKVLYPKAFHSHTMRIKDQEVELHPLVIKYAKQLGSKCDSALKDLAKVREGELDLVFMPKILDGLLEALCYMGQLYKIDGLTKEWCEENMLDTDVTEILEVQLALMGNNSFLVISLRNCLNVAGKMVALGKENLVVAIVERMTSILSEVKAPPSTASARTGT